MSLLRAAIVSSLCLSSGAAFAETTDGEWGLTGVGRLFNNDYFGDNEDRWRTGSYVLSFAFSKDRERDYADQPFGLMELRLRSEVIAPRNLNGANSADRAYAGILSVGVHTHYEISDLEISVGSDWETDDAALMLGKQLSDRLYLAYAVGLFDAVSTVMLRYTLTRQLHLEARSSTRANSLDLIWEKELQ